MKRRAVFFDRDGTLIREKRYLHQPGEVELFPETIPALKLLAESGFALVIVSNQSGVARGYFTETDVQAANGELSRQLASGGVELAGLYYCPHLKDGAESSYAVDCDCRKPAPGMVRRAASDLNLELAGSWIVGDKECDIALGNNAGLRTILVRTGYGREVEIHPGAVRSDLIVDNILEAAEHIAAEEGGT
jgi:D-glycero-D-manno-heptose 1,7-bisphosphate phosphatase